MVSKTGQGKSKKTETKTQKHDAVLNTPVPPKGSSYPELTALDDEKAKSLCKEFSQKVKDRNVLVCFLLDFMPNDSLAGLELSSFRRAELLQQYCGVDPWLMVNYYQPSLVENGLKQINLGRLHGVHLASLYDFIQGINRNVMHKDPVNLTLNSTWKVLQVKASADLIVLEDNGQQLMYIRRHADKSIDYVNFLKNKKIVRRDTYDPLGFLSRTEFVEPEKNYTHTALYYRPDRTIALIETYKAPVEKIDRPIVDNINILNKNGFTIQRFCYRDELIAWWLLQLLGNKKTKYICIADQLMDYQRYFVELKRQREAYSNVKVVAVSHNCHTVDPLDVMHSTLGDNYRFLCDQNQQVDRVVTLTAWQKEDVIARFKENAHPMTVIPHAVPYLQSDFMENTDSPVLPPHALVLVGRFSPVKNQLLALDLITKVRAQVPDATLHFYGTGEEQGRVSEEVKNRQLQESVIFHGFCPDLKQVYRSAAITLSLSEHEGFPLNIIESLSLGCPVVAFACRYGPSEQIADGEDGYLLPYGDLDGAVESCVKLLADADLLKSFRKNASEHARRFSQQRVAALWAGLLNELLEDQN